MSSDTLACLEFVLFVFVLFVFCLTVMFAYMYFTEPEILKEDVKLFRKMMKD